LFEKLKQNEDYETIFTNSSLVFDVITINSGEISRIVFVNFDRPFSFLKYAVEMLWARYILFL